MKLNQSEKFLKMSIENFERTVKKMTEIIQAPVIGSKNVAGTNVD